VTAPKLKNVSWWGQGLRQKNFKFPEGATKKKKETKTSKKKQKIAKKKRRKIALLSLYLLYLYHVRKSKGGTAPRCRRPWVGQKYFKGANERLEGGKNILNIMK